MRLMTLISQRPVFNTPGRQTTATAGAKPAMARQLPPGFQPIHVKGSLPGSVLQRLAERSPRLHADDRRGAAQALIDAHLATGGGMSSRSALRV